MKKHIYLSVGLALSVGSCASYQDNNSTLDAIQGAKIQQPFVEAYVEYAGPHSRWAGPAPFVVHLNAKNEGNAVVDVSPSFNVVPEISTRTLASEKKEGEHAQTSEPAKKTLTSEQMRDQLAELANAVQTDTPAFKGCLSPVRVRMMRMDGSLLEKQGCRSHMGWPAVASKFVSQWVAFAGQGEKPADAPAHQPAQNAENHDRGIASVPAAKVVEPSQETLKDPVQYTPPEAPKAPAPEAHH